MRENVSRAEAATRMAAFLYLLTPLAVFPLVLMAVQDWPSLPRVTYSRSLESVNLTHIPFETIVLGVCFIGIFLVPLLRILSSSKLELNFTIVFMASTVVYAIGAFIIGHIYPMSLFKSRSVCSDGFQICYPFGVYGYLIFFALLSGIAVGRALHINSSVTR
jgi:hypothetical protein